MRSFVATVAFAAFLGAALVAGQPGERAFATESCIEAVPGPVTDLAAVSNGDKSITFTWNAPNGQQCVDTYSYFVVEKGHPDPRSFPPPARDYSVTVNDLKPNTEYVVKVAAVNQLKGAGPMASVTIKTDRRCLPFPPGPIGNVYVNQPSNTRVILSWLPPPVGGCSEAYEIEGEDANTGKRVLVSSSTVPEARLNGVNPGTKLIFRITALHRNMKGPTKRVTYDMKRYGGGHGGGNTVASGSVPAGH